MKKNDYSYKNLYQHIKPETKTHPRQIIYENRNERSKENNPNLGNVNNVLNLIKGSQSKRQIRHFQSTRDTHETKSTNRFHTEPDNMLNNNRAVLKKQFKLYGAEEDQNTRLKQKIQKLEEELKRKFNQNGVINYFKTQNSSSNLSHIDIYMELARMEEESSNKAALIKEHEKKLIECHKQIEELLVLKQENQKKFASHTEEIKHFNEIIDKLKAKMDRKKEEDSYYQKYYQIKTLFEQIQKQRSTLLKRNKQLEESIMQEEAVFNIKTQKIKQQHNQQLKNLQQENRRLQDEVEKYNLRCQEYGMQNQEFKIQNFTTQSICEELKNQVVVLTNNSNTLNTSYCQLKDQNSMVKKQVESMKQQLKNKQDEIGELKKRIQVYNQKFTQYESMKSEYCNNEKKAAQKMQILKEQHRKCEQDANHYKIQINQAIESNQHLKSVNQKAQSTIRNLNAQLKKNQDQNVKLQYELSKLSKQLQKSNNQNSINQIKLQSLNEKRQSNERYRLLGKLKETTSKIKAYIKQPVNIDLANLPDDFEKGIEELQQMVSLLISETLDPVFKQIDNLNTNIKTIEFQKECLQQSKQLQLQVKNQAIKTLFKFVPDQLTKVVQEYLILIQDIVSNCTNESMTKKISLLEWISKESERIKGRQQQEESKRHSIMSMMGSKCEKKNETRKMDKSIKRDVIHKKYFQL